MRGPEGLTNSSPKREKAHAVPLAPKEAFVSVRKGKEKHSPGERKKKAACKRERKHRDYIRRIHNLA